MHLTTISPFDNRRVNRMEAKLALAYRVRVIALSPWRFRWVITDCLGSIHQNGCERTRKSAAAAGNEALTNWKRTHA